MPLHSPQSRSSLFPTYLLTSIPFRRRSSTATASSSGSDGSGPASGSATTPRSAAQLSPQYLTGNASVLRCTRCLAHLCSTDQIISKGFTGRHGRAYLVAPPAAGETELPGSPRSNFSANLPNTRVQKPVPRQLVTGAHTVSDISCLHCESTLGWKYVAAEEESQRYKVGKFILETKRVQRGVSWEIDTDAADDHGGALTNRHSEVINEDDPIEFDSQDEDECEDLFMGIWSEALAKKRRKDRAWRKED